MDGHNNYYGSSQNWFASDDMQEPADMEDFPLTSSQTEAINNVIASTGGEIPLGQDIFVPAHNHDLLPLQPYVEPMAGSSNYQPYGVPVLSHNNHAFPHLNQMLEQPHNQLPVPLLQNNLSASNLHDIAGTDNWPGNLNYQIEFSKSQDKTKATPWIFSPKLDKLFVSLDKACPIHFKLENVPPEQYPHYRVRGQIMYTRPEDFNEAIVRCINHQQKDPSAAAANSTHVLRCDDSTAMYVQDQHSKRHSVVVNLKQPAPGTKTVTVCFRFMCLSSCIGSLNRRPTKLIFTLEDTNGEVKGRYSTHVRICSCPGRDIRGEEVKVEESQEQAASEQPGSNNLIPIAFPPAGTKGKTKKRKTTPPTTSTTSPTSRFSTQNEGDVYKVSMEVHGREQYELIRDVVQRIMLSFENRTSTDSNDGSKRVKKEQP